MMVWPLFARFLGRTEPIPGDEFQYYLSPERLHGAIARERLRADRSGATFSLLTLTLDARHQSREGLEQLASVLRGRLRVTDEPGLFADWRVGIVLPDTPAAGAWVLGDELRERAANVSLRVSCAVDAYPNIAEGSAVPQNAAPVTEKRRSVGTVVACLAQPMPAWKRATDVVGAALGLVVCSPVLLAASVAIKLTSRGPVIFRQPREGLGGREFTMLKLRTMREGAAEEQAQYRAVSEQDGPAFKLTHDPRVTRVGKFLRVTSIDELPQLWNVLRGEMSLVGPRPLPCEESRACQAWQRRRLDVTPGITCIWQVRGRSQVSFTEWVRMDLEYVAQRSFTTDLKLLLATVPAVLLRRGAK